MKEYSVDLSGVRDTVSLHQRLADTLCLPSWYGRNLDALYDALTEFAVPARIRIEAWEELPEEMGGYRERLRAALLDARADTPGLEIVFAEIPGEDTAAADPGPDLCGTAPDLYPGPDMDEDASEPYPGPDMDEDDSEPYPVTGAGEDSEEDLWQITES